MIYVRCRLGGLPEVPSLSDEVFHSSMILLQITAWYIGVNLNQRCFALILWAINCSSKGRGCMFLVAFPVRLSVT